MICTIKTWQKGANGLRESEMKECTREALGEDTSVVQTMFI